MLVDIENIKRYGMLTLKKSFIFPSHTNVVHDYYNLIHAVAWDKKCLPVAAEGRCMLARGLTGAREGVSSQ